MCSYGLVMYVGAKVFKFTESIVILSSENRDIQRNVGTDLRDISLGYVLYFTLVKFVL